MEDLIIIAAAVALSALLSVAAYGTGCLTKDGAVASFFVGAVTGVLGSLSAFALLTVFTVSGFAATRIGFSKKKAKGLQEGKSGERTWKNVVGVGLAPCIVVALNFIHPLGDILFDVAFISTLTVAGADTIASEIGVRDPRVYLVTTMRRVPPGTNGGISRLGTAVSTAGALFIAVLGWAMMEHGLSWALLIPFAAGVVGNLLDSVFGTLLEDRGYISKYMNNFSTAMLGSAFGACVCVATGCS